jgi:putative membrane protein
MHSLKPLCATSSLALLLFAVSASAQQSAMQQQAPSQPQPAQTNTMPSAPANATNSDPANIGASPATPQVPNYADQSFVEDTLKSNGVQIQASQLAQQKASSGDVKEFSQRMLQIHNQLNTQLAPFAKMLQVNTDQKPSKKDRQELAKLDQLSGSDFDTAYMQVMATQQQRTLKKFKSEENASNPNIQKLTKADGPVLDQNYQILQKIAQTHNIPLDTRD